MQSLNLLLSTQLPHASTVPKTSESTISLIKRLEHSCLRAIDPIKAMQRARYRKATLYLRFKWAGCDTILISYAAAPIITSSSQYGGIFG